MLPWSVSASARWPSFWHAATRSPMRFAPSSRLYSEWTWRWTKSGAAMELSPSSCPQQLDEQLLLRVQAVLGLLVDEAAPAVENLVRDFEVPPHGHRVHQARVLSALHQRLVDHPSALARA